MFNAETAFNALAGQLFTSHEALDQAMRGLHRRHIRELSPAFGPRELFDYADRRGWVLREVGGLRFVTKKAPDP